MHAPCIFGPTVSCFGACVSLRSLDSKGSWAAWEKTAFRIPGSTAPGFAPSARHKAPHLAGGRRPETIGTERNREYSEHRRIPPRRPAGDSFRHSN